MFSVGSLMYSVATGRLPFRAETPYGVLQRINDDVVQPVHCINPELPAWLSKLIAKLQAKSPDDRYDTADEAATLVRQCLLHLETADKDLPMSLQIPDRTYPAVRRWAAVVATAITLSGVLAAAIVNWPRLNRFSGAQTASYSPPPSTHREPAAPVSFWDDPRPAELVDQTSQLLTEMTLP